MTKKMPQVQFIKELKESYDQNVAISEAKNSDYANSDDAFANFRACEMLGIDSDIAILVRMTDKMMRISNLLSRPAQVKDESIYDTLSDLANYATILKVKHRYENSDQSKS